MNYDIEVLRIFSEIISREGVVDEEEARILAKKLAKVAYDMYTEDEW